MQDGNTDTSAVQMAEKPASKSVEKTEKKASKKNSNKVWLIVLLVLSVIAAVLAVAVIIVAIVSSNSGSSSGGASGSSADGGGSSLDGEGSESSADGDGSGSDAEGGSSDDMGVYIGPQGSENDDVIYSPSNWGAVSEITEEERQLADACMGDEGTFGKGICIVQVYKDANDLDKLLNVYAVVLSKLVEQKEYVQVANMIAARSTFLAQIGKCDTAMTLLDTIEYESFSNDLQAIMYDGGVNAANTCGYTEAEERWNDLFEEAMKGVTQWGG